MTHEDSLRILKLIEDYASARVYESTGTREDGDRYSGDIQLELAKEIQKFVDYSDVKLKSCPDVSEDHPTPISEQARIDTLKRFGVYIKPVSDFEQKRLEGIASRFDVKAELEKALALRKSEIPKG